MPWYNIVSKTKHINAYFIFLGCSFKFYTTLICLYVRVYMPWDMSVGQRTHCIKIFGLQEAKCKAGTSPQLKCKIPG